MALQNMLSLMILKIKMIQADYVVESKLLYALAFPDKQDHLYLHRALLPWSYFHRLTDFLSLCCTIALDSHAWAWH